MYRCSDAKTFALMKENFEAGLPMFKDIPMYLICQSNGRIGITPADSELGYVTFRLIPDHSNSFYMADAEKVLGYFPELMSSDRCIQLVQAVRDKDFFTGPNIVEGFAITENYDGTRLTYGDVFDALQVAEPVQVEYKETMTLHPANSFTDKLEEKWRAFEAMQSMSRPSVDLGVV